MSASSSSILVAAAFFCLAGTSHAEDCSDPLVKTAEDAGRIAFAMWRAANPQFTVTDEHEWVSALSIKLDDCVWMLSRSRGPYSEITIKIGAKDGRFLGAVIVD